MIRNIVLVLSVTGCKFINNVEINKIKDNNFSTFKENMEVSEEDLEVNLIKLTYEENLENVHTIGIKEILGHFEECINTISGKEKILRILPFLKEKATDLETSNRFYEDNVELARKNQNIAKKKIREIFHFLCKEKDIEKIYRILEYVGEGFRHSGARTILEIERALYEVKEFSNLENKINFLINRSKEIYLELASGEEVYSKSENAQADNPHMVSYLRNIMKDLLNLHEDYYSEEDFNFYNSQFSNNPIDKELIRINFKEMYSPSVLINSIEEYISNKEIEDYIKGKFGDIEIDEFLVNREAKIKTIKAILISMGHLIKIE